MDGGIQDGESHRPTSDGTYKGNAGSQEKNPHQEVFELLYHQLPQRLAWGEARRVPGVKIQKMGVCGTVWAGV